MALQRSFWILQLLLAPVRLALAAIALTAVGLSLYVIYFSFISPIGALFLVLAFFLVGLGLAFGTAIFGCIVWAFVGLVAAYRGDASRLRILRSAELALAIILSTLFVLLYLPGGAEWSIWTAVVATFTGIQWAGWYLLGRWTTEPKWQIVDPGPVP